ncbi:hypothetical protein BU26DRAFT_564059 [Trematosphaeria pertusa]|uniref:Uncharacterized protein n=1 Tax=Trematosphaeria pertusa TaxID=390896 RepID=A0A6A6IJX5_9PLEO|nr:uncharacterized protein BU26DRAFT_564059 [Trematosphaeria pertusa]KAF2250182.1 hypothetical protein BU26DRAFT_564059 [Trematosphaeria pertusa]
MSSQTPDEICAEIAQNWSLQDAADALPGRLQPSRTKDATAWPLSLLENLQELSRLAPDKLKEVQIKLGDRIDFRRAHRTSREQWVIASDIPHVIRQYRPPQPRLRDNAALLIADPAAVRRSGRLAKKNNPDSSVGPVPLAQAPSGPHGSSRKRRRGEEDESHVDASSPRKRTRKQHKAAVDTPDYPSNDASTGMENGNEVTGVRRSDADDAPEADQDLTPDDSLSQAGPGTVDQIAEGISVLSFGKRYPIPANATIDEEIELLEIQQKMERDHAAARDGKLEYKIKVARIRKRLLEEPTSAGVKGVNGDPLRKCV